MATANPMIEMVQRRYSKLPRIISPLFMISPYVRPFPQMLADSRLHPLRHARHNNSSIRQQNDKKHLPQRSLDRVRKAYEPERDRLRSKFLILHCVGLYVVECRHKVCGDFCHFLFGYSVGRILFTSLEKVFQRTAVIGRALGIGTIRPTWLKL
jgi:hypothetical protein